MTDDLNRFAFKDLFKCYLIIDSMIGKIHWIEGKQRETLKLKTGGK